MCSCGTCRDLTGNWGILCLTETGAVSGPGVLQWWYLSRSHRKLSPETLTGNCHWKLAVKVAFKYVAHHAPPKTETLIDYFVIKCRVLLTCAFFRQIRDTTKDNRLIVSIRHYFCLAREFSRILNLAMARRASRVLKFKIDFFNNNHTTTNQSTTMYMYRTSDHKPCSSTTRL